MRALPECQIFFLIAPRPRPAIGSTMAMWLGSAEKQALMTHRSIRAAVRKPCRARANRPLRRPGAGGAGLGGGSKRRLRLRARVRGDHAADSVRTLAFRRIAPWRDGVLVEGGAGTGEATWLVQLERLPAARP